MVSYLTGMKTSEYSSVFSKSYLKILIGIFATMAFQLVVNMLLSVCVCSLLAAKPLAYYSADGNAAEPTGKNGTLVGSVSFGDDGFGDPNGAFEFSGGGVTLFPFDFVSNFSFASWVLIRETSSTHTIFGGSNCRSSSYCREGQYDYMGIRFIENDFRINSPNGILFLIHSYGEHSCFVSSNVSFPFNERVHLAITYKQDSEVFSHVYFNGVDVTGPLYSCTPTLPFSILPSIGASNRIASDGTTSFTQPLTNGTVDEIYLYDDFLSHDDVKYLYNLKIGGGNQGTHRPKSKWVLNDGMVHCNSSTHYIKKKKYQVKKGSEEHINCNRFEICSPGTDISYVRFGNLKDEVTGSQFDESWEGHFDLTYKVNLQDEGCVPEELNFVMGGKVLQFDII